MVLSRLMPAAISPAVKNPQPQVTSLELLGCGGASYRTRDATISATAVKLAPLENLSPQLSWPAPLSRYCTMKMITAIAL